MPRPRALSPRRPAVPSLPRPSLRALGVALAGAAALASPSASPSASQAGPSALACKAATAYSLAHRGVAVLVLDRGTPVCEAYRDGDAHAAHELWSGTKSFVGLMAAAAVQDGLLAIDEPVAQTVTEWQADPARSATTVAMLLSMTSGQPSTIGHPPSYADAVRAPLTAAPGTRFQYGPTPMQLFGEVMRRKLIAAGQPGSPVAYLKRRILDPIGMEIGNWRDGPDGNPLLPQGAALNARQWAKIGEFVRAGGIVGGRPIVDRATLARLFTPSTANPTYGMTWWLPHAGKAADVVTASTDIGRRAAELPADLVMAAGAGDQRLYVVPSQGLTIVRQADLDLPAALRGERSGWSDADFLVTLGVTRNGRAR